MMVTLRLWSFRAVWWKATIKDQGSVGCAPAPHGCFYLTFGVYILSTNLISLALKPLLIYLTYVNCMSMTIVDGGLMVKVVVGWTKTLWNCGSIVECIIFFIVNIINIL